MAILAAHLGRPRRCRLDPEVVRFGELPCGLDRVALDSAHFPTILEVAVAHGVDDGLRVLKPYFALTPGMPPFAKIVGAKSFSWRSLIGSSCGLRRMRVLPTMSGSMMLPRCSGGHCRQRTLPAMPTLYTRCAEGQIRELIRAQSSGGFGGSW